MKIKASMGKFIPYQRLTNKDVTYELKYFLNRYFSRGIYAQQCDTVFFFSQRRWTENLLKDAYRRILFTIRTTFIR